MSFTFLANFDKWLLQGVPFAFEGIIGFLVVAVLALEFSRRLETGGTFIAIAMITGFALWVGGFLPIPLFD